MPMISGNGAGVIRGGTNRFGRKSAADLLRDSETGRLRLTPEYLKQLCKEMDQYTTPSLNDQLYLHFKGFQAIESLEEYTGLKCLWLEGNGLMKLEGLEENVELRGLYAQQNCIKAIENISHLRFLDTLNLSNNMVRSITGLAGCVKLNTLYLAHNKLSGAESLRGLEECPSLGILDVSNNLIEEEEVWPIIYAMPNLKVLNMMGNKVKSITKQYRKTTIVSIPGLTYLDDRPVFPKERVCAVAFLEGGRDAERVAREEFVRAEKDRQYRGVKHVLEIRDAARRRAAAGDPDVELPSEDDSSDDDGAGADGDKEKTEGDAGYEDWQFGKEHGEQQRAPNFVDQMSGNVETDLTDWKPHPDWSAPEAYKHAEALKVVSEKRSQSEKRAHITGPLAGDMDLFDDDDEYEVLDDGFLPSSSLPAPAAGGDGPAAPPAAAPYTGAFIKAAEFEGSREGFAFYKGVHGLGYYEDAPPSAATRLLDGIKAQVSWDQAAAKPRRAKMKIEEVGAPRAGGGSSPRAVVEDPEPMISLVGKPAAAAKKSVFDPDSDGSDDSEAEEIEEEIAASPKKKWFQAADDADQHVPVSLSAHKKSSKIVEIESDDEGAPPDLEQVDVATGNILNIISGDPAPAAQSLAAAAEPAAATKPKKMMIEMIGGDDMESLD